MCSLPYQHDLFVTFSFPFLLRPTVLATPTLTSNTSLRSFNSPDTSGYHILLKDLFPSSSIWAPPKPITDGLSPKRGTYIPRKPTDIRSPCPAINALANHGYIARSGRDVRASEIYAALGELGVGSMLGAFFTYPPFIELHTGAQAQPPSWWSMISNPLAYALSRFAIRNPRQKDTDRVACLNLDQLARYNVVEHDVSLSRFDHAQGDNLNPQQDLIKDLLAASRNGSTLTVADFVRLRKAWYERQKRENPESQYARIQNQIAYTEVALILQVFGDGVKCL